MLVNAPTPISGCSISGLTLSRYIDLGTLSKAHTSNTHTGRRAGRLLEAAILNGAYGRIWMLRLTGVGVCGLGSTGIGLST